MTLGEIEIEIVTIKGFDPTHTSWFIKS